jgi:MOSC domain-containing protein YiiM
MAAVARVRAIAGIGLEGDRYAAGTGHWSAIRRSGDSLTLIEAEEVEAVAASNGLRLPPGSTRRNVTTRGVRLDELLGRRFRIGEVECLAVRRCEPCAYLDGLLGQEALPVLVHRAGIRAEILTDGEIALGDAIEPIDGG